MTNRLFLAAAAAVFSVAVSASGASAFPAAALHKVEAPAVTKVTFWGKPFPYRYTWRWVRGKRVVVSYKG